MPGGLPTTLVMYVGSRSIANLEDSKRQRWEATFPLADSSEGLSSLLRCSATLLRGVVGSGFELVADVVDDGPGQLFQIFPGHGQVAEVEPTEAVMLLG